MSDTVTSVDADLVAMMRQVFLDAREKVEEGPLVAGEDLWSELDELGLVRLTGDEDSGGSGAGWAEAAELLRAAAGAGVRVPLGEHDLLACRLLADAGLPADDARRTVAELDAAGTGLAVPWASTAGRIVLLVPRDGGYAVADVAAGDVRITPGTGASEEARDTVYAAPAVTAGATPVEHRVVAAYRLRAALVRGVQVSAALDRILELTVEHVRDRVQFGRPLARFQAVQHLVADIACEAELARAATGAAVELMAVAGPDDPRTAFAVAVARSCAGHAASVAVRNAHQALGAIGTTREHRLHEYTRAALAWRNEFGAVREWDRRVAAAAADAGGSGLWPLVVD
ncbi:acyl-CoA dehydrogenase family protein [Pseudonocardia nematodicida]|uniref:Acyl-CoA dehydrogenase family protein n=1 Tax=Pseudonocardia nematodicida TaxID=1206997 RepID=A0ABV1K508_9PSEU